MRPSTSDPFALDLAMVDALLDGRIEVDDAPPGYGEVLGVLRAADAPVRPNELDGGPEAIRRIFEEARRSPAPVPGASAGGSRRLVERWSLRGAIVAIVALFAVGGGVALAATGNLPGPLQGAASRAMGVMGVTVPDGSDIEAGTDPDPSSDADPSISTPTDPKAATDSSTSNPPTTSTDPTASVPSTPPSADPVPTTSLDGVPGRGDEICAEASDGQCRAGEPNPSDSRPGRPDDVGPPTTTQNPSVTAPGKSTTVAPATPFPTTTAVPPTPTTPPHPDPGRP